MRNKGCCQGFNKITAEILSNISMKKQTGVLAVLRKGNSKSRGKARHLGSLSTTTSDCCPGTIFYERMLSDALSKSGKDLKLILIIS